MRAALNSLQSPAYFDYNSTLTFTVGDLDFEFEESDLEQDEPSSCT